MGRIYLRALEPDDYKVSVKWRNDDEISKIVGGPKYFVSAEREKQWVHNAIFDNEKLVLAICIKDTNEYIGNVMLQEIDNLNRSARIPVLIGDRTKWNKGYATEACMMMMKFAFEERGIERVYSYILEENKGSIKMYQKCGYKTEGLLRNSIFKNGRFHNQVLLAALKEDFYKAYDEYVKTYQK